MIYVSGKSKWSVEDQIRLVSFRVAWNTIYAGVGNTTERFLKSIAYSAQPILNPKIVAAWWEWTRGRKIKSMLDEGMEPPAILRPAIEAYRKAMAKRARETGDDEDMLDWEDEP